MAEFKFFCAQCGQQIQCDTGYSGTQINCPACQQPIVVPQMPRVAAPAGQPPAPAKSHLWRNVLVVAASVVVLAGLVIAGWFGYAKLKRGHLPPGAVAVWSGNGDGKDLIGGNNATLKDITFADGKGGKVFVFNGKTSLITVPASESLAVSNLTLAAWIFPTDLSSLRPIIDYGGAGQAANIHLWINTTGGTSVNPGGLHALIRNAGGGGLEVDCADPVVKLNQWNFVAFTANLTTGTGILYCNGSPVITNTTPDPINCISFEDVNLGYRNSGSLEILGGRHFLGKLGDVSIYNRPLSAAEIKSIYKAH
jgi:DNA-directed RNA polymerase subunit RPC12/RpoP